MTVSSSEIELRPSTFFPGFHLNHQHPDFFNSSWSPFQPLRRLSHPERLALLSKMTLPSASPSPPSSHPLLLRPAVPSDAPSGHFTQPLLLANLLRRSPNSSPNRLPPQHPQFRLSRELPPSTKASRTNDPRRDTPNHRRRRGIRYCNQVGRRARVPYAAVGVSSGGVEGSGAGEEVDGGSAA